MEKNTRTQKPKIPEAVTKKLHCTLTNQTVNIYKKVGFSFYSFNQSNPTIKGEKKEKLNPPLTNTKVTKATTRNNRDGRKLTAQSFLVLLIATFKFSKVS